MGWLPSAPQLASQSAAGVPRTPRPRAWIRRTTSSQQLKSGALKHVLRGPGQPGQLPAQPVRLALEPARLLGQGPRVLPQASARHRSTACRARTSARPAEQKPEEVVWRDDAPEGKLDLLVTLDFRMSTTCLYSDIVLPTATWYEKNDLNTSDMHPFIHPLSAAVDPVWESRWTGRSTRASRRSSPRSASAISASRRTLVLTPLMHDTPGELAQPLDVKDWKKGECDLGPRQDRAADRGDRARLPEHLPASSPRSGR